MSATDTTNDNPVSASGAEFEENSPVHKVTVTNRPRVNKPESGGDEADRGDETETNTAAGKHSTNLLHKSAPLQPDISKDEVEPEESAQNPSPTKPTANGPVEPSSGTNIQSLIESGTYFVPIGQVAKRRNTKIFVTALAIVVAVCIGAYILLIGK